MSAHYAMCKYDDDTGSYIPLEVRPITDTLKKDDPLYQDGFQAGAASRDAEIADLKRKLANEQARDIHSCHPNCSREGCVNRRLRAELAAALAACKVKGAALLTCQPGDCSTGHVIHPSFDERLVESALAIQPDDSELKTWLGKRDAIPEGWVLVPKEILDRFPETDPRNYDHDDVCSLNDWGVELVLAAAPKGEE